MTVSIRDKFLQWQSAGTVHPLTCSGGGGHCSGAELEYHDSGEDFIEMKCPVCHHIQREVRGSWLFSLLLHTEVLSFADLMRPREDR